MKRDFLPGQLDTLCEWCENMKMEFAQVASSLGFTSPEIMAFLLDLNWVIYNCRASKDAQSNSAAWVQFRNAHLYGSPAQPVGSLPGTTVPTPPAGGPPANGLIGRVRAFVARIKVAPAYTTPLGQTLRVIPVHTNADDANAKPDTRGKSLPMFKAEVRCKRGDFDAVRTRCRIDGDPDWTDLGLSVGTTLVDERPPAAPGKPEVRTYEQIYVRGNQPVGQWSDSVRVTLQP